MPSRRHSKNWARFRSFGQPPSWHRSWKVCSPRANELIQDPVSLQQTADDRRRSTAANNIGWTEISRRAILPKAKPAEDRRTWPAQATAEGDDGYDFGRSAETYINPSLPACWGFNDAAEEFQWADSIRAPHRRRARDRAVQDFSSSDSLLTRRCGYADRNRPVRCTIPLLGNSTRLATGLFPLWPIERLGSSASHWMREELK